MASGRALFRRQLKGGDYSQHNSWRCLDRPGHDDDELEPAAHKQDVPGVAIPHRVRGGWRLHLRIPEQRRLDDDEALFQE